MATRQKKSFSKKGTFVCGRCNFSGSVFGFGRVCPFSSGIVFLEDTYIGRDPFSPDPKPLILGSNCVVCNIPVCVSQSCSVFYTKRYCVECFKQNISKFPQELVKEFN